MQPWDINRSHVNWIIKMTWVRFRFQLPNLTRISEYNYFYTLPFSLATVPVHLLVPSSPSSGIRQPAFTQLDSLDHTKLCQSKWTSLEHNFKSIFMQWGYPNLSDVSELSRSWGGPLELETQTSVTEFDDWPSSTTKISGSTPRYLTPFIFSACKPPRL